jgi:hypothetical protein
VSTRTTRAIRWTDRRSPRRKRTGRTQTDSPRNGRAPRPARGESETWWRPTRPRRQAETDEVIRMDRVGRGHGGVGRPIATTGIRRTAEAAARPTFVLLTVDQARSDRGSSLEGTVVSPGDRLVWVTR